MITKKDFDKLYNPDISKREYDRILGDVQHRALEIWKEILRIQNRRWHWFDFDNEGGEDHRGNFDPCAYQEEVRMTGEFEFLDYSSEYVSSFPTEFIWTEDFEWQKIVLENYNTAKIEHERKKVEKRKRIEQNLIKRAEMKKIISSKLTQEELKYISFK